MATNIRVYGTDWCHSTFGVREYLMNARLDYDFFDVDRDPRADEFVRALAHGERRYPVIVLHDAIVTNPTVTELGQLLHTLRMESDGGGSRARRRTAEPPLSTHRR